MSPIALSCLLVFAILIGKASSLSCNYCYGQSTWDNCDKNTKVVECTRLVVHDLHLQLQDLNPSLPIETSAYEYLNYQCYELELQLRFVAGPTARQLERGCTFERANFCNGWDQSLVAGVNCSLSDIGVPGIDDSAVDEEYNTKPPAAGSPRLLVRNVGSLVGMVVVGLFAVKAIMC